MGGRRALALMVGAAACGLLAAGCGGDGSDGNEAVNGAVPITVTLPFGDSILWAGYEISRGKDGPYEVDYALRPETRGAEGRSFALQALLAGEVDFAVTGPVELMIASARGQDALGIAAVTDDVVTVAATRASGTRSIEDLDRKVIGVAGLSGDAVPVLVAALWHAGIDRGGVEIRVLGVGKEAQRALRRGEVAAYVGTIGQLVLLERTGIELRSILDERFAGLPADYLAIRPELAEDDGALDRAIDLMKGWYEGTLYGQEFPRDGLRRICGVVADACQDRSLARAFLDRSLAAGSRAARTCGGRDLEALSTVQEIAALEAPEVADVDPVDVFVDDYTERMCPDPAVVEAFADRAGGSG